MLLGPEVVHHATLAWLLHTLVWSASPPTLLLCFVLLHFSVRSIGMGTLKWGRPGQSRGRGAGRSSIGWVAPSQA